jgi:hypothetical protein
MAPHTAQVTTHSVLSQDENARHHNLTRRKPKTSARNHGGCEFRSMSVDTCASVARGRSVAASARRRRTRLPTPAPARSAGPRISGPRVRHARCAHDGSSSSLRPSPPVSASPTPDDGTLLAVAVGLRLPPQDWSVRCARSAVKGSSCHDRARSHATWRYRRTASALLRIRYRRARTTRRRSSPSRSGIGLQT